MWRPIKPPKPVDEQFYDIRLKSGKVIQNVEYWRFGGCFCALTTADENQMVKYPLSKVESFKDK